MAVNKKYLFNSLLVILLLLSVGTLIWGSILLVNGQSGGQYVRAGAGLTLISTIWLVYANLDKKHKQPIQSATKPTNKSKKRKK